MVYDEKEEEHRNVYLKIDDLDLDTSKGQNMLLIRLQEALTTKDINSLDLKIMTTLKDTIKAKTNIDVLTMFSSLRAELDDLKKKQK